MNRVRRFGFFNFLLALCLVFFAIAAQEAYGKSGQSENVKVVKRVRQAQISQPVANALKKIDQNGAIAKVMGTTVQPNNGSSMWELSNGSYLILGYTPNEGTIMRSEYWKKNMGDGDVYWMACTCPNFNPNEDDQCKFDDVNNPSNPGNCSGPLCSCAKQEMLIKADGTVQKL